MRLSDYKGEEALDVLADIIEPLTIILTDKEIQDLSKEKAAPIKYVKPALKNHKSEVIGILARLENKPVEEFEKEVTIFTLPKLVLEFINDSEVQSLFRSQGQVTPLASSGSAMENTEAKEN